jgi:hypothetical protein
MIKVVDESGDPLDLASVTALADNGTYKDAVPHRTRLGIARFQFQTRRRLRVLVGHPERPGAVIQDWDPIDNLRITLPASENTGSVICHGTGYIPGLEGRLEPILDARGRTYLYANNIAIRGGERQPASFEVGVPLSLEDANGTFMQVRVLHIQGDTSLLEYVRVRRSDAGFSPGATTEF